MSFWTMLAAPWVGAASKVSMELSRCGRDVSESSRLPEEGRFERT